MSLESWLAFVAASAVLLALPGPTILTVISYSVAHGRRANVPLVAAVALGDTTALALSLLGLGTVLAASATAFTVVKVAGGLYLLFLAFRLLRAGFGRGDAAGAVAGAGCAADRADPAAAAAGAGWKLFGNTYLVTALNPKGIVFFVAFLPQFISPAHAVAPQLWLLAATFVVMAALNATLYALFAAQARRLLATPLAQRRFNLLGGSLLAGAGVWALLARRPA